MLIFFAGFIVNCFAYSLFAQQAKVSADSTLVNVSHLNYLYVPVVFADSTKAAGVYIYAETPDYHFINAGGEGFVCVDDAARAALVYLRSPQFISDTAVQNKAVNLLKFVLKMQSANGYFYNFLFENGTINKTGSTSINGADWWSWRAFQTLTEAEPLIKNINASMADEIDTAIDKLVNRIKLDFAHVPQKTKSVNGVSVPQWLPAGSGTDQTALLIISLISYYKNHNDEIIKNLIKQFADGIIEMQAGDTNHFPYACFLSWENTWHAYGNLQAYALLRAGIFLNNKNYTARALNEINNFYPWLLQHGYLSSFSINKKENRFQISTQKKYDQIAYGIEPMLFAAEEAYKETGENKYADIAGHIAAWFFGDNEAHINMYNTDNGVCFDGIRSSTIINKNSGAESTIEALLVLQAVESFSAIKTALNKYRKNNSQ